MDSLSLYIYIYICDLPSSQITLYPPPFCLLWLSSLLSSGCYSGVWIACSGSLSSTHMKNTSFGTVNVLSLLQTSLISLHYLLGNTLNILSLSLSSSANGDNSNYLPKFVWINPLRFIVLLPEFLGSRVCHILTVYIELAS